MKTQLTTYKFNLANPLGRKEWEALQEELSKTHQLFNAWGSQPRRLTTAIVTLGTHTIFNNQWNCDQGRVFDWFLDANPNLPRNIRQGHYLTLTDEMLTLRDTIYACGYCGHQEQLEESKWCDKCLDSEYLKENELYLTWMINVNTNRSLLADDLIYNRINAYKEAQLSRTTASVNKVKLLKPYEDRVAKAQKELEIYTWLLNNNVQAILPLTDTIYYDHKGLIVFGWNGEVNVPTSKAIKEAMKGSPYSYEIKVQ